MYQIGSKMLLGCVEVVVRGHHQCPQRPPSLRRLLHQWSAVSGAVPSTGRLGIHTPLLSPKCEVGSTSVAAQRCPPPLPPLPHPSIHHPLHHHHLHPSSLENANTSSSSSSSSNIATPTTTTTATATSSLPTPAASSSSLAPSSSNFSPSSTSSAISPVGGGGGGGANLISCLRSQVASSSLCDLPAGVNNSLSHQQQPPPPPPGLLPGGLLLEGGSSGGGYHGLLGLEGCSPQLGYSNVGDAAAGVVTPTSLALTSLGYGPTPIARTRPPTGEEVACSVCGKILCNKYVLKTHLRDMHGPRQSMQCPVCHRMYASLNSLRAHMSGTHKKAQTLPQSQQPPQRF